MNSLYRMIGISKQGHYKRVAQQERISEITSQVLIQAGKIRKAHKRMGCRKLYSEINPDGLGRDRTEAILLENGFRVKRKRRFHRTSFAGQRYYDNHIQGMKVTDVNQLWVSDITYVPLSYRKWFFLTLIQDVYSRRIVGWSLANNMTAEATVLTALKKSFGKRRATDLSGTIFHSDKGKQYSAKVVDDFHKEYGLIPSMGGKAWENAHAESINGVLKNEYIDLEGSELRLSQAQAVIRNSIEKYNQQRPHGSLRNMKPVEFENYIKRLKDKEKPIFLINY